MMALLGRNWFQEISFDFSIVELTMFTYSYKHSIFSWISLNFYSAFDLLMYHLAN